MTARTAAHARAQRSAAMREMGSPESQRSVAATNARLLAQEIQTMLNMKHAAALGAAARAQREADLATAAAAARTERIAAERLANLEKARAVKAENAANAAAQKRAAALARRQARRATPTAQPAPVAVKPAPVKETPLNQELAELKAQVAALTAALSGLTGIAATPAPVAAPEPVRESRPVKVKPEYVATSVKLVNHGHGQYSQTVNGTKVAVAWNGADKVWAFACGRTKGAAADRGAAVAALNTLLAAQGLPPVRA